MWEFLQANSYWIVLGVFLLLMMRMHAGGGCGMGHGNHQEQPDVRGRPSADEAEPDKAAAVTTQAPPTKRSGGCH